MKGKVVIIGSGLGGLECACILARHGYSVTVLEKHSVIGGCLQTFRRSGRVFDTGFHYVGGLGEGESLRPVFDYLGLMDLPWKQLDVNCFDEVCIGGHSYPFASGHRNFVERLCEFFPASRAGLEGYATFLKEVGDNIFDAFRGDSSSMNGLFCKSAYDFLCGSISDPLLRQVLSGTSLKMELQAETLPLYTFAQINNSFIQSAWRLEGGGAAIASRLAGSIRKMGGEVLTDAEAVEICVANGRVEGVRVAGGCGSAAAEACGSGTGVGTCGDSAGTGVCGSAAAGTCGLESSGSEASDETIGVSARCPVTSREASWEFIPADYVISDIHPATTLALVKEGLRNIYRSRISVLANTFGMFTANICLKPGSLEYLNHNLYIHSASADLWRPDPSKSESVFVHFYPPVSAVAVRASAIAAPSANGTQTGGVVFPDGVAPFHTSIKTPCSAPQYATHIDLLSPMDFGVVSQWKDLPVGRRGAEYAAVKARKAEECINLVSQRLPQLRNCIDQVYTNSPLTYLNYTGTPCGSAYGLRKDWNNPMGTVLSPHSPIQGLLFTGQNLNLHGILGTSMTAVLTTLDIIGPSLIHEILG